MSHRQAGTVIEVIEERVGGHYKGFYIHCSSLPAWQ